MLSFLASPLLVLAIGPSVAYAACPYAQQMGLDLNARDIPHPHPPSLAAHQSHRRGLGKDGVMLMNRIAPGTSKLYISDIDGSNERRLLSDPVFEYHACFSTNGQWVLFTSERNGDGNSDIWCVRTNRSDLQPHTGGRRLRHALTDWQARCICLDRRDDRQHLGPRPWSLAFAGI